MPDQLPVGPFIIFTDLDGTLLDHHTYSYAEASPALALVKQTGTPLVLASSKTAAEIAPLRAELGFEHCPAIVENGSGTLPPFETGDSQTSAYANIIGVLSQVPNHLKKHFKGFNHWTSEEIAEITSLDPEAAVLAKQRQFSEPGLWTGSEAGKDEFKHYLQQSGLKAQQGGRFFTISHGASKADRMSEIIEAAKQTQPDIKSVALGDAPNDKQMLETADIGFIIQNNNNVPVFTGKVPQHVHDSKSIGPKGWNECISDLLGHLDETK